MITNSTEGRQRIRILRVITRLNIGGPAIHVINLTAGLDAARFDSCLVCGTELPGEGSLADLARQRGLEPIALPEIRNEFGLKPADARAIRALAALMRRLRPHIVHTHTAKAGFLGRVAARRAGVPVVVHTYHGHVLHGYFGPARSWALRRMERWLARRTRALVTVSELVKREPVDYRIAPAEKIRVIPLGFELAPFRSAAAHRGEFRCELGLDGSARLVGIVGRIFPVKNHGLFLESAARVAQAMPEARFVVVGDGALRVEMEQRAAALGIAQRTVFTGWRRDLPRIYADLDALVVSSVNEGTPVAAIEAMAAGCPVVATRVGGLPDLLGEGGDIGEGARGLLVAPQNAEALSAAILCLLRDRDLTQRLTSAAQTFVACRFNAGRLLKDTGALYETLWKDESGKPRAGSSK